ncbi:MAG TPA: P-loop NTPase [Alphaproteobacteria bacterium]|jgi:pilus assembly protein CpaE
MSASAARMPSAPSEAGDDLSVMAFLADDVTRQTLTRLAGERRWLDPVIEPGGVEAAHRYLADGASSDLLIVDLSEAGDPLGAINGLADVCEPGTRVIALGTTNDVKLFRALIEAGVVDYLVKPVSADDLQRAIDQANGIKAAETSESARGQVIAVVGARGGVGASTIALNLAWLLSQERERKVALVDLDLHFGSIALSLDLETGNGFRDVLQNPSRIDPLFLERASIRAAERLIVLGTEEPLTATRHWDAGAFRPLLDELTKAHEVVLLDLPRGMVMEHPELLAAASTVLLAADMSLSSLRDSLRLVSLARELAPRARLSLALNRPRPAGKNDVPAAEFAKTLGEPIGCELPFDAKAAVQAAGSGKPFVATEKSAKAAQALRKLATGLVAAKKSSTRRGGLLARFRKP